MGATLQGFQIAVSGMQTYHLAANITAHNLANTHTKGYSKQTLNVKATTCGSYTSGISGDGVTMTSVTTNRNDYYDTKYRNTQSLAASYETKAYYLNCIENYLYTNDEKAASITSSFDDFFSVLTDLSSNAPSNTNRTQVVTYAETLTEFVKEFAGSLESLQKEANAQIKTVADSINALAEQISSLTKQINTLEVYGSTANDLRDQRNVLLDSMSEYVSVEVLEREPADGVGFNQYLVYVNGSIMVDGENFNQLVLTQRDKKDNLNDIAAMYEIKWSTGDDFPVNGGTGGTLQTLFEVRDGNNGDALAGKLTSLTEGTDGKISVTLEQTNVNSTGKLNIPASNGSINLCGRDYEYDSFEVEVAADGTYKYTFLLTKEMGDVQQGVIQDAITKGVDSVVGNNVNFKGIPYYMAQMNEFVRVFSEEFNRVHNQGYDLDGNPGMDFFNGEHTTEGTNYILNESVDGIDPSFSSLARQDASGNYIGSYYYMNCQNFCVTSEIVRDPEKIAGKVAATNGNSDLGNLEALIKLKSKADMFSHGAPDSFLQSIVSSVGVEGARSTSLAASQTYIKQAVESRRLSVSGVDEDEEGTDLVKFQNLLFNQYKVLSVMDEILDKLINGTAV